MDHVRNEAKTSKEAVESSLANWQHAREQKEQVYNEQLEMYREKHEKPRLLREEEYRNYLQMRSMAYQEIKEAPASLRKQKIIQWLKVKVPEQLKEGLATDLIYTSR
jgi:hypothetical protein